MPSTDGWQIDSRRHVMNPDAVGVKEVILLARARMELEGRWRVAPGYQRINERGVAALSSHVGPGRTIRRLRGASLVFDDAVRTTFLVHG